ncbi:MAG: hypothetical protein Q8L55_05835 [Phycisphaerales bacterium]|nr:hypothetical protein [Phycisphaerales bacterium]
MPSTPKGTLPAMTRSGKVYRRFRRTVRACALVLIGLVLLAVVLTQGPVPKWLVARSVRKASGAVFDASWVSLRLDGRFIASDATLTAPESTGLVGEPARVAQAKRIEVELDWSAWAAGVVVPTSVTVVSPVVRVSLDRSTKQLNLASLTAADAKASAIARVPRIDVVDGLIIVGEQGPSAETPPRPAFEELVRFESNGWISPVYGTKRYLIRFHAQNPDDALMDFDATGEVDLATAQGDIRASSVDLSRWTPQRVPSTFRALWEKLRLRGRIAGATLRYTPQSGIDTTLRLDDVSLNAPIASGRADITGSRNPRMEGVTGTLRVVSTGPGAGLHADLRGLFEDLPARVRFDSRALTLDAAYSAVVLAERFELEKDPRILWFTPEVVQRNFEKFSGPTAVIDARIEITRRPPESPGVPGETSIAGTLIFENGSAAFDKFPYPIVGLSGTVRFDDDKVQIVGIQGRGPTGARLFAEGTIDPPTADSRYDIRVTATDLPVDDVLRSALLASKGAAIVDAVFSEKRLAELVAKGLIAPDGPPGREPAPNRQDGPPRFSLFSGTVDSIQVHVTSGFGKEQPVHQDVAVRFREVHALPDAFPYPLIGRDIAVRIGDDFVLVRGEGLTGLHGGSAQIDARIDTVASGDAWDYRPTVHLRAEHFPIEPLLINALPETLGAGQAAPNAPSASEGFSIKRLLSQLNLAGPVEAEITVVPGATAGEAPRTNAAIVFEGVHAHPAHEAGTASAIEMSNLIGAIRVSPRGLFIDSLEGRLAPTARPSDRFGPPLAARFRIDGDWYFDETAATGPAPASRLGINVRDLDVALTVEDLLRPIVPGTAETVARFREQRLPSGRADLQFRVERTEGAAPLTTVDAQITSALNLQVNLTGERIEILQESGTLGVHIAVPSAGEAAPPVRIILAELAGLVRLDGQDIGHITASGVVAPPAEAAAGEPATPLLVFEPVDITLRGLQLESPVARQLAGRFGGDAIAGQIESLKPEGILDGELRLALPPGVTDPSAWTSWLALRPRWLAITMSDADAPQPQRLVFPLVSGQVTIEESGGAFEELTVVDEGWTARFNGLWTRAAATGADPAKWGIDGRLAFESDGTPPTLLAMLPPSIASALADANIQVFDGIDAPATTVRVWSDGPDTEPVRYLLEGAAEFAGLFANPGITVDDARGRLAFWSTRDSAAPARTELTLSDAALRIAGLRVTGAAGSVRLKHADVDEAGGGAAGGSVLDVPMLTGNAYGGRLLLHAHAVTLPLEEGAGDGAVAQASYEASLELAGLRFADLLRDLQRTRPSLEGPLPPSTLVIREDDLPPDGSRGLVEAQVALRGVTGDTASRRGRGEVRIAGGNAVLDVPGLTTILSLAALQLPVSSSFDFAHADVHIEGDTLVFDRTAVLSDSLALLGAGTMRIDTRALDLRMAARGRTRIPLLTDLLDAFRDELFTARIRGTPDAPEFTLENFAAVRSVFAGGRNPLAEALRTDLDRLERDRQRTLRIVDPRLSLGGEGGIPAAEHVSLVPLAPTDHETVPLPAAPGTLGDR